MSEPVDIVEVLRRPLETISQCRRMRYVTDEVAEIAAGEIISLRRCLAKVTYAHVTGELLSPEREAAAKAFVNEVCGEQLHTAAGVAVKEMGRE